MIGATYPVLASAGSDRSLSRTLSPVVPVVAESPSAPPPAPAFSTLEAPHSSSIPPFHVLHSTQSAAKNHSIPSDGFRLRSMNSIRSAPARPFRRFTPSFRRSTSDRILLIIGNCYFRFAPNSKPAHRARPCSHHCGDAHRFRRAWVHASQFDCYRFAGDPGGVRVKWPLTMGLRSSPSQSSYTMRWMVCTLS